MSIYQNYATQADLATFLGIPEVSLPSDSTRLLTRASELVKQSTQNNIDVTNADHMEAAKLATCANVEFMITMGETVSISQGLSNFSLGDLSMSFGSSSKPSLSPRARGYLSQQHLLYRGLNQCNYLTQDT